MQYTMRWFGPNDPVPLQYIRQAGCTGVVTALHHIPVGDVWTIEEINKRKAMIEAAGMTWTVIESLAFIAFDVFLLQRPGAEKEYTQEEINHAKIRLQAMSPEERDTLFRNALLGSPGSDEPFTKDQVLTALQTYQGIDTKKLKQH